MAITIQKNIPEFNSTYNKQELAVSSEHFSIPGFNYVFRVNVEGVAGFKEFRALPEPSQNFGVKDFHKFIETFVFAAIFDPQSQNSFDFARIDGSMPSIIKYDIDIFELWTVAGVPTLDPDGDGPVNTGDKFAFEGSFPHHKWIDEQNEATPYNQWLLNDTNGIAGEFLTNNKLPRVKITDDQWTYLLTDTPIDIDYLEVKTFDSDGVLIQTVNANNLLGAPITNSRMLMVASGPQSLNNIVLGIVLGAQPIITAAVASYTIQIFKLAPATAISELLTFNIEEVCRYVPVRVSFLNEFGGFDSFNFNFRNQESDRTRKATGNYDPYNVISTGIEYANKNSAALTLETVSTPRLKIRSEYLTDDENAWLRELIRTREAYVFYLNKQDHSDLKPIKEVVGVWVEKERSIDKLFTIDLDLIMSWDDHSQRR